MPDIAWCEGNHIKVKPPKKPKKLTGTRFAAILGLNHWTTPFEVWCAVTRTYEKPFEDTIYTLAGKTIEPKQAAYMKERYFMGNLISPTDVWGADYFKKTRGDFFPNHVCLGGAWDYLLMGKDGNPTTVLEMKTSKRVEDWQDDIPEYYALQAALYAYLLGVDNVIMVASFLDESDYENPDNFVCSASNTVTRPFKMSERYPDFEELYVKPALKWWADYVDTGISPVYDEKRDAEILKALRTNTVNPETDIHALVCEAEELKAKLDAHAKEVADVEKRYKTVTEMIKKAAMERFRPGDELVTIAGKSCNWEVSKSVKLVIDKEAMENDGVVDKYTTAKESFRLTAKTIKEK